MKTNGNSYSTVIGKSDVSFSVWVKTEILLMIPDEYEMSICVREGKTRNVIFLLFKSDLVEYMIACDPSSIIER